MDFSDLSATRGFVRADGRSLYFFTTKEGQLYMGLEVDRPVIASRHEAATRRGPLPPPDAPLGVYAVLSLIPVTTEQATAVSVLADEHGAVRKTTASGDALVQSLREQERTHWLVCLPYDLSLAAAVIIGTWGTEDLAVELTERRASRRQMRQYGYL